MLMANRSLLLLLCRLALHLAVIEERVDVVKFLLSKGADAGIKNMDGKTPKELANTDEVRKCF